MLLDKLLSNLAVHVEPFALCLVSSGWRLRLPPNPGVMIHFVLRGYGSVRGPDGLAISIAPSSLAVVPICARHSLETVGNIGSEQRVEGPPEGTPVYRIVAGDGLETSELVVACGVVGVYYGQSLGLFDHLKEVLCADLSDIPEVRAAFSSMLAEQSQPSPGSVALTDALMTTSLVHMLRRVARDQQGLLPWLAVLEDRRLGRAMDRILENPARSYTVESLAGIAAMSRSAFAEKFTEAFGRPPMSLLHHIRMQRAARLLQEETLSVEDVARRVGFSSRSHFSRAFKKHCGISPAAHRAMSATAGS